MLTTLIAITMMAPAAISSDVQCAVQPDPVNASLGLYDYAGVRYGTCCAGCVAPFTKEPAKFIKAAAEANRTIGTSLFDPVSGVRTDAKKATGGFSDYKGTRFFFGSKANKDAFDATPAKFATSPAKEALYCPVMGHETGGYAASGAISDYEGVRYYLCCTDCLAQFKANPGKYVAGAASKVTTPKLAKAPKEKNG